MSTAMTNNTLEGVVTTEAVLERRLSPHIGGKMYAISIATTVLKYAHQGDTKCLAIVKEAIESAESTQVG